MEGMKGISLLAALGMTGAWSNAACLGYAILALEALGFEAKEIHGITDSMKMQFDEHDVNDAIKHHDYSIY